MHPVMPARNSPSSAERPAVLSRNVPVKVLTDKAWGVYWRGQAL